jgi:hypothetical protein
VSSEHSDIVELHGEASAAWFELAGARAAFLMPSGTLEQRALSTPTAPKHADPSASEIAS